MRRKSGEEVERVVFASSVVGLAYANVVFFHSSSEEFLFDFGNITPGKEGIEIFSRIALSPRNAKLFMMGLMERVKKYEEQFGEIHLPPQVVRKEGEG
ncbi:DUF3467 domain-containing protein [Thermospira aquatica]|uniref:DUF3467 domain-containing protein n=1 Tax=Thermospira aquatica TaxID=2828656 RepID=A0AAX3BE58_9SPIR|nr:DUF3467 domain-containing protein [Thermospira aquatica]URA10619.1 DUF3467 domain-containing protein [Thermospira aquatica]